MITLDSNFDSASLKSYALLEDGSISIEGRDNHSEIKGEWKWIYFIAHGVKDWKPRFVISNNFEPGASRLDRHRFWWSADGEEWKEFDFHEHDRSSGKYSFGLDHPIPSDQVHVAFSPPYPIERAGRLVKQLIVDERVKPSPSCIEGYSLGKSPGGKDELGRVIHPSDLFALEMGAKKEDAKKTAVILGGVHPNEMPANFALEGFLEKLLEEECRGLLNETRFLIYPMVNPDGRYAGYNRSTVQHLDHDANRHWNPELWEDMLDIRTIGEAILKDTDSSCDYFIDFHSWTNSIEHMGILSFEERHYEHPIWQHLLKLDPTMGTWGTDYDNWSSETFGQKMLSPEFNVTYETMYLVKCGVECYKEVGRNMAQAMSKAR